MNKIGVEVLDNGKICGQDYCEGEGKARPAMLSTKDGKDVWKISFDVKGRGFKAFIADRDK